MTLADLLALSAMLALLAAMPSASVLMVISQTLRSGRVKGYVTVAGIVAGDLVLLSIALLGISQVSHRYELVFLTLRGLGALYLFWLGYQLLIVAFKSDTEVQCTDQQLDPIGSDTRHTTASSSRKGTPLQGSNSAAFLGALMLTLGDIKALLFYASLLPAMLTIQTLTTFEISSIVLVTLLSVGIIKSMYVQLAERVAHSDRLARARRRIAPIAGVALILAATWLVAQIVR